MNWEKIMITRDDCVALDESDILQSYRRRFVLPPNLIYFDGNSLGPMPHGVQMTVAWHMDIGWGVDLITAWNKQEWFSLPMSIGEKIGRLIGAGSGNTIVGDTISINLFKVLSAVMVKRPDRKVILSDNGNFPSDLYVAQGLNGFLGHGHELRCVAPDAVEAAITDDVAVLMLTDVDYRTSRRHDMARLTKLAHDKGCLVIWDLSHSAGALPVDLLSCDADFAVGCTYKYLNGGPGAPGFVFVHPRHQADAAPALVGWWGHAEPFAFDTEWKPASGIARFQCGTQPVLSVVALDAAMMVWNEVDMGQVHAKSQSLCGLFVDLVEAKCAAHGLKLAGPRDFSKRGSHVSFAHSEGYAVMQALIASGVIGDFRAPDLMRFGFAPLYNTHVEVFDAVQKLVQILDGKLWDRPEFRTRKAVT
jgi:kynureninase